MLIRADARAIPMADNSVHMVVTSPPYFGLRNYETAGQIGLEESPAEYVAEARQGLPRGASSIAARRNRVDRARRHLFERRRYGDRRESRSHQPIIPTAR